MHNILEGVKGIHFDTIKNRVAIDEGLARADGILYTIYYELHDSSFITKIQNYAGLTSQVKKH